MQSGHHASATYCHWVCAVFWLHDLNLPYLAGSGGKPCVVVVKSGWLVGPVLELIEVVVALLVVVAVVLAKVVDELLLPASSCSASGVVATPGNERK